MEQKDRLILMVGVAAVLLSAGFGTALATGGLDDRDDDRNLVADWSKTRTKSLDYDETNTRTLEVLIEEHNITSLVATLTWTDDEVVTIPGGFREDVLTLLVEGPPNLDVSQPQQTGTAGELQVVYTLDPVPDDPDPDNFDLYDRTNATGTWLVTITVDANGIRDTGNDWTLVITYTYYEGQLIEVQEEA